MLISKTEIKDNGNVSTGDYVIRDTNRTYPGFLRCNGSMINKKTYSVLYSYIGDNFRLNETPGAGQPWREQYNINYKQTWDLYNWAQTPTFPFTPITSNIAVTKNRVYMMGYSSDGINGTNIYSASISSDGVLGTWTIYGNLDQIREYGTIVVQNNRLYIIGGLNNNPYLNTIYSAPINQDGTLGGFSVISTFPTGIAGAGVITTGNYIHVIGGASQDYSPLNTVYSAIINTDGTLGSWTQTGTIPVVKFRVKLVNINNFVYLIGSEGGDATAIYRCKINNDGSLGSWSLYGYLPEPSMESEAVVTNNMIYLFVGNKGSYTSDVYKAEINTDGSIGSWTLSTPIPIPLCETRALVTNSRLYLLGGYNPTSGWINYGFYSSFRGGLVDYSPYYNNTTTEINNNINNPPSYVTYSKNNIPGYGQPWREQYYINYVQSGNISSWTTETSLPFTPYDSSVLVTKNRVYVLGSINSSTSIYTASINIDGTLGSWNSSGNLPQTQYRCKLAAYNNWVYIIGGQSLTCVYRCNINSDGTLGSFIACNYLPVDIFGHEVIATNYKLHVIGGNSGGNIINTIYTSTINQDGSIGPWVQTGILPVPKFWFKLAIISNFVYMFGGAGGTGTEIYRTSINSDGTLTSWIKYGDLPAPITELETAVTNNTLYIIGGNYNSIRNNVVLYYNINTDGTLGPVNTGTPLPKTTVQPRVIVTSSKLYVLQIFQDDTVGWTSGLFSANFQGGSNDYSTYDAGKIPINVNDPNYFRLPDFTQYEQKRNLGYFIKT